MINEKKESIGRLLVNANWFKIFATDMFGRNYFNIDGRASRKEFWAFNILGSVFSLLVNLVYVYFVMTYWQLDLDNPEDFALFDYGGLVISFIISIPSITLSFRRFHDINMSAWWGMLVIPMFFLPFFKGDQEDNRFGENIY